MVTLVNLLVAIDPIKDLAALIDKEALEEKALGKIRRPKPTIEERNFCRLRRSIHAYGSSLRPSGKRQRGSS